MNLVLLHIMESNCPYSNFQQAKSPLICSQQSGFWLSLFCTSTLLVQSPNLCHVTQTCLYQTRVTKNPVINQSPIISHFLDKPKFVADEIWFLLTMWGQWTFFRTHVARFFSCSTKDICNPLQYQRQITKALALKIKMRTHKTHKTYYTLWILFYPF